MGEHSRAPYILGLDLGPNSVGWAALQAEPTGEAERLRPVGILGAGSRVFEAGVQGTDTDIEQGRDEPKGQQRRQARLARRGLERRGRRLMVLYLRLAEAGLVPGVQPSGVGEKAKAKSRRAARLAAAQARDAALKELDRHLWEQWAHRLVPGDASREERLRLGQVLPYALRTRALDERMEPHELGRALFHLGQRRGFLSNRKAPKKKDEKPGAVEQGIGAIRKGMEETESRTLGEYFFRCDPFMRRIRERYTSRDLYQEEFERIWTSQAPLHTGLLTEGLKKKVYQAIFHQRPLKNQKFLVGFCELEPKSRRAPAACLEFQRFRVLQQVNHTAIVSPDGVRRSFSSEERNKLIAALESEGPLSFKEAKKQLGLKQNWTFNFESGGESRFQGNRTAAKLHEVFGDRWDGFTMEKKEAIISDLLSIQRPETLKRRGHRVWGLEGDTLDAFAAMELEEGHASLSRRALRKILPFLEQGMAYTNAREAAGYKPPPREPLPLLPPLKEAAKQKLMAEVRNPAVTRTLSEMRKVVNALIARRGRPAKIRVELGRDLRNPRDRREAIWKANRKREKEREQAAKKILDATGDANPSRADKEKVMLAEECGWQCPYTGKTISPTALLGQNPQFDVEHIVPYSLCLDDSFLNKTLCDLAENRSRKRNKTPWAAYGADPKTWGEIIDRVKAFKGDAMRAKLERFQTQDTSALLADFTTRQLNDTRYAARLAREYLGLLYGGTTDADGTVRVQVAQGRITADLRGALRLGSILRDGGAEQKRDDHRHHAVDAVAVALTSPAVVKTMSDLAAARSLEGRKGIGQINAPWEGFQEHVRAVIDAAKVSHRPSHTVSGRLHEDTIYSPPKKAPDGKEYVHVRKRLDVLSKNDIEGIVDPVVQAAVRAKLAEIGGSDPKKLDLEKNPPVLKTKHGGIVPIRKVRIRRPPSVFAVGHSPHQRHVVSDANHHVEIAEVKDPKGRAKWEGHIVPLFEAYRRLRAKESVVKKDHGPGKRFLFSLAPGDCIEMNNKSGIKQLFRLRSVSVNAENYVRFEYVALNDARLKKEMQKAKAYFVGFLDPLRKAELRKVTLPPLGDVRYAND